MQPAGNLDDLLIADRLVQQPAPLSLITALCGEDQSRCASVGEELAVLFLYRAEPEVACEREPDAFLVQLEELAQPVVLHPQDLVDEEQELHLRRMTRDGVFDLRDHALRAALADIPLAAEVIHEHRIAAERAM